MKIDRKQFLTLALGLSVNLAACTGGQPKPDNTEMQEKSLTTTPTTQPMDPAPMQETELGMAEECIDWDPSGECIAWEPIGDEVNGMDNGSPTYECVDWDPTGECIAWDE